MSDVRQWLGSLGLGQYADALEEQAIDWDLLPDLTDEHLQGLGIGVMGHRMRILKAITALDAPPPDEQAPPDAPAPDAPGSAAAGEAERRQLTVMFSDVVDSTALSRRLDPEELRDINLTYQDAAREAIEGYGGFIARYMGDGVLAYFGYPQAHEDDAQRAILAGLRLIDVVPGLDTPVQLAVRIGIATGPVVVGDIIGEGVSQESAVVGETPNLSSRLQAVAGPDELVVGEQTHRLAGGAFTYADLGGQSLKGFEKPVQAWRVTGFAETGSRFEALHGGDLGAFIGREHDLGMLLERWHRALAGEGQAVLISGEAGIGKSRAMEVLRARLADEDHVWVRHQCTPHHTNSALYPFIAQLERASGFVARDDDADRLGKLEAVLTRGERGAGDETVALLAALLSIETGDRFAPLALSPQEQKARTFEALTDQLVSLAGEAPVLWGFEDAHWADPTSRELLAQMIDRLRDLPVLAIVTARPEYAPAWVELGQADTLRLGRLSRAQSRALVDSLTGDKVLPEAVLEQILARTDGVPLFVEELTRTVLESDLLVAHADRIGLSGPLRALTIPSSLQDSLMARLDRLGDAKRVAQCAAAIGREFTRGLLARVVPDGAGSLESALHTLVEAGMIFPRGVAPAERFVFKHALLQDAARESMLRRTRQAVHGRIAEALEAGYPTVSVNEPEVLAYHFSEAGEMQQAVDYWRKAGLRSARRSAYVETVSHLTQALHGVMTLPESSRRDEQELAVQTGLGPAQMAVEGFASEAVEQAYTRARELCERTGRSDQLFQTLYGLFRLALLRGKCAAAHGIAGELLDHAEKEDDRTLRITGHRAIGNAAMWLGRLAESQTSLSRGIALYEPDADGDLALVYGDDPAVDCLSYSALTRFALGDYDQVAALSQHALALARDLSHPFSLARALGMSCFLRAGSRGFDGLADAAREALEISSEHGIAIWGGVGEMFLGIALANDGDVDSGNATFRKGYLRYQATGARLGMRFFPTLLADAHARRKNFDAARELFQLAVAGDDEGVFWDAEMHRLEGDLGVVSNAADSVIDAAYDRAMAISRAQGARALQLRAAISLARHRCRQGRRGVAADLLASVHATFPPASVAPDVLEARQLIEALSG